MIARLIVALTLLGSAPAWAAEPSGCDKFKWPIDKARTALTAPDRATIGSGAETAVSNAVTITLVPPASAKLPSPPERAPKDGTFAGFVAFKPVPKAGLYTINLSAGAWIDVVQDDAILKPVAFSGATDCDGIRKTVQYDLSGGPFVMQISGATDQSITVAVLPAE
jgi:hypothetical protein